MDFLTGGYDISADLDIVERRLVFDFLTVESALYGATDTNLFPKQFLESDNSFKRPCMFHRITHTPTDGHRFIFSGSIPIDPLYGVLANGIWNHIQPVAPNLILPPL